MPHRTEPRRLILPYGLLTGAGVLLTLYQPPSIERLTSAPASTIWHVVLLAGSMIALAGAAWRREAIEAIGATLICGPLAAYSVILGLAGHESEEQGRYATWAIAVIFLTLVSLIAGRAAWLWNVIRAAKHNHDSRRRAWI